MSRRRKHYRGITDVSFGDLKHAVTGSVKGTDVLTGVLAGLAGTAAAKFGAAKLETLLASKGVNLPDIANDFVPLLGAGAAGLALHVAQKGSARSDGHLVGALAAGLTVTAGCLAAKYNVPGFNGIVNVSLKGLVTPAIPLNRSRLAMIAPNRKNLSLVSQNPRTSMGQITSLTRPSMARAY